MKTNLKITGRVELDHDEITKAIIQYLRSEYGYRVTSVTYPHKIQAVANVRGTIGKDPITAPDFRFKEKDTSRPKRVSYTKKNIGIFETIRQYFNDRLSTTNKEVVVPYTTLSKFVFDLYPNMDDKRLKTYLADKRQFKNLIWSAADSILRANTPIKQDRK